MDIENELSQITVKKKGNTEMAFFYHDKTKWDFHLGNPSRFVNLGETIGELQTSGNNLEEVINKMKIELERKT